MLVIGVIFRVRHGGRLDHMIHGSAWAEQIPLQKPRPHHEALFCALFASRISAGASAQQLFHSLHIAMAFVLTIEAAAVVVLVRHLLSFA